MKQKYILFALLSLIVASCTNQEIECVDAGEVQVTADIAKSRVSFNEAGDKTYAYWQTGDAITLSTPTQSNLNYTATVSEDDATVATFAPEASSLKDIDGETVYACYPAATITDGVVSLPATNKWTDAKPLPFAYAVSSITESKVDLTFEYVFAFLKLTLSASALENATSTDGDKSVHGIVVKSASEALGIVSGTFNFADKSISVTEESKEVLLTLGTAFNPSEETERSVYIPILPQSGDVAMTISLMHQYDGGEDVLLELEKQTPTGGFVAGNVYTLTLGGNEEVSEVAFLCHGSVFNERVKQLANKNAMTYLETDSIIQQIEFKTGVEVHLSEDYVEVSADDSQTPVYASFNATDGLLSVYTASNSIEIVSASRLFSQLKALRTIDFGNFGVTKTTTGIPYMFDGCLSLQTVDCFAWDTSNVTDMHATFNDCNSLTSVDVSNWDTSNVTDMVCLFQACKALTSIDVSNWDTSNVTNMGALFNWCVSLKSLNVSKWNTGKVTRMYYLFQRCEALRDLDVSNWDTSNVTDMLNMFASCKVLTSLDVSKWNTSNVANMHGVFSSCEVLASLDVSNWDTGSAEDMSSMFYSCGALTSLDVSLWNTASVINMSGMFQACYYLTDLNVSDWNTSNVTDMSYMFGWCHKLSSLSIPDWDTSKVTDMSYMFCQCVGMATLDLANWDTSQVTNMNKLFRDCYSLVKLDISNWSFNESVTCEEMFTYCASDSNPCEVAASQVTQNVLMGITESSGMKSSNFTWVTGE